MSIVTPLWAYDTEDDSKGHVKLLNFYNGKDHYSFRKPHDAVEFVINGLKHGDIWACNAEYDLNNLFGADDALLCERTYLKTSFVKARIYGVKGVKVRFLDTLRHWKMSVAAMGDKLGFKKLPFDPDSLEYCQRDTEIVWRWVNRQVGSYRALGAEVKATIGSSAISLAKNRYDLDTGLLSRNAREFAYKAIRGGRVEIFRTGIVHGRIDGYDVNSMYPFVMMTNEYPEPRNAYFTRKPDLKKGEGLVHLTMEYPHGTSVPCMPVRLDTLQFPVGHLTGHFCYPEVRQALNDGAIIVKIHNALEFPKRCRPFKGYVADLYGKRKASIDELERDTLKGFMNNLFGKFGARSEIEIITGLKREVRRMPSKDANMVWTAYTTCYARLHLLKALREHQDHLLYCDTDSMYLLNAPPVKTSKDLGGWKHEGTWGTAHFVLPKVYMLDKDGQKKFKCKGVKPHLAEQFYNGYEVEYESPVRFRESFSRGIPPNVWIKKTRKLRHKYNKRIVLPDGRTRPHLIKGPKEVSPCPKPASRKVSPSSPRRRVRSAVPSSRPSRKCRRSRGKSSR